MRVVVKCEIIVKEGAVILFRQQGIRALEQYSNTISVFSLKLN